MDPILKWQLSSILPKWWIYFISVSIFHKTCHTISFLNCRDCFWGYRKITNFKYFKSYLQFPIDVLYYFTKMSVNKWVLSSIGNLEKVATALYSFFKVLIETSLLYTAAYQHKHAFKTIKASTFYVVAATIIIYWMFFQNTAQL